MGVIPTYNEQTRMWQMDTEKKDEDKSAKTNPADEMAKQAAPNKTTPGTEPEGMSALRAIHGTLNDDTPDEHVLFGRAGLNFTTGNLRGLFKRG